jgi:hypothetical protein
MCKPILTAWLTAWFLLLVAPVPSAAEPEKLIKKTLDGRCLAPDHPEYWDTKIYVAKTSMEQCVASGGTDVATEADSDV